MTAERCPHERLDYLDPGQHRGWVCGECGASGPTAVWATDVETSRGRVMGVRILCVCGSGVEWPFTATGGEVARYLAEHADCKPPGDER